MQDRWPRLDEIQVAHETFQAGDQPSEPPRIDPVGPLRLRQRSTRLQLHESGRHHMVSRVPQPTGDVAAGLVDEERRGITADVSK